MNYFPFHIGDYMAHTAHLSVVEDLLCNRAKSNRFKVA